MDRHPFINHHHRYDLPLPPLHHLPPPPPPPPHPPPSRSPPFQSDPNMYFPHHHHHHHLPPPPPPPPPPPAQQPLPPPPQSYRPRLVPPPPPPVSPRLSQFSFPNINPNSIEDDRCIDSRQFLDFDNPSDGVREYEQFYLENRTQLCGTSRPVMPYSSLDYAQDMERRSFDQKSVLPLRAIDRFRDDHSGSFRFREEYSDRSEGNQREEFVCVRKDGRSHDNYHRYSNFVVDADRVGRNFRYEDVHSSSSRGFESNPSSYDSRHGWAHGTESNRNERDGLAENQRWVHKRQSSRDILDSSYVMGNNNESGDEDRVRMFSGKHVHHVSESGRYGNRGSREHSHEYKHSPRKQIQKKSALLRIQMAKPSNRNRDSEELQGTGYFDNFKSGSFRVKDQHFHVNHRMEKVKREGTPVELDVSFKSNSLVAKAIVPPSSSADVSDADLIIRDRKIRKVTVADSDCPSSQFSKLDQGSARLDCSTHDTNNFLSSEEGSKQLKDKGIKHKRDSSVQPSSNLVNVSLGNTKVESSRNSGILEKTATSVCSAKTSLHKVLKKKKVVKKVVKKVMIPRSSLPSTHIKKKCDEHVTACSLTHIPDITSESEKGVTPMDEETPSNAGVSQHRSNKVTESHKVDGSPQAIVSKCDTFIDYVQACIPVIESERNSSTSPICASSHKSLSSSQDTIKFDKPVTAYSSPHSPCATCGLDKGVSPLDEEIPSAVVASTHTADFQLSPDKVTESSENNKVDGSPQTIGSQSGTDIDYYQDYMSISGNKKSPFGFSSHSHLSSSQTIKEYNEPVKADSSTHSLHTELGSTKPLDEKIHYAVMDVMCDADLHPSSNEVTEFPENKQVNGSPQAIIWECGNDIDYIEELIPDNERKRHSSTSPLGSSSYEEHSGLINSEVSLCGVHTIPNSGKDHTISVIETLVSDFGCVEDVGKQFCQDGNFLLRGNGVKKIPLDVSLPIGHSVDPDTNISDENKIHQGLFSTHSFSTGTQNFFCCDNGLINAEQKEIVSDTGPVEAISKKACINQVTTSLGNDAEEFSKALLTVGNNDCVAFSSSEKTGSYDGLIYAECSNHNGGTISGSDNMEENTVVSSSRNKNDTPKMKKERKDRIHSLDLSRMTNTNVGPANSVDTILSLGVTDPCLVESIVPVKDLEPSISGVSWLHGNNSTNGISEATTAGSNLSLSTPFTENMNINISSDHAKDTAGSNTSKTVPVALEDSKYRTQRMNPVSAELPRRTKQPSHAVPRTFPGRSSFVFTSSKKTASSASVTKPRTWHRTASSYASTLTGSKPLSSMVPSQRQLPEKVGKFQSASYIRKGNSLVRKPNPVSGLPQGSHGLGASIHQFNSSGLNKFKKSSGSGYKDAVFDPSTCLRTGGTNALLERPRTPPLPNDTKLSNHTIICSGGYTSSPLAVPLSNGSNETTSDPMKDTESNDVMKSFVDPPRTSETSQNQTVSVITLDSDSANMNNIRFVKRTSNQLVAASSAPDLSLHSADKTQALPSEGYFKRSKNQLIRTSLEGHIKQTVAMPDDSSNTEQQRHSKDFSSKSSKRSEKAVRKSCKHSKFSLVWTLSGAHPSERKGDALRCQKVLPHLFPWKRATSRKFFIQTPASSSNNSSLSLIGRKLLLTRKRNTIYTRSKHGFSLRKSKVLSVGGSSLKWSKSIERNSKIANEEATLALAAAERQKREQDGAAACRVSGTKRRNQSLRKPVHSMHPGNRIFRVGSFRYKMDSSKRTLHRILDDESPCTTSPQPEKDAKKSYVPRRLLIGNDEYVRIGNGNQLIRDPKKRSRTLASEKVRWSLHTARQRLARKRKYCQFFTRFGKCNKDDGKCPYIHDTSKIAVCTKFLNGLCSNPNCKLTHKVIPERMPDCSYYLQGLCSNKKCPYRHVNVNPKASTCEGFLRGYCAEGDECRKKHSYVCPNFEATGSCPQGSKCKLHHPRHRSKGKKRKRSEEEKNARGRYFGSMHKSMSEARITMSEKHSAKRNKAETFKGTLADFICLDDSDEEVLESNDPFTEQTIFTDSELPNLELDNIDELIKPFRIMKKFEQT